MSKHPEWATRYKEKNTELRCIRGKYYLYKITHSYNKETQVSKKVTLGQIGVITEEEGLIPTGMKRKGPVPKGQSVYKENISPPLDNNFLDDFKELTDPRSERNKLYGVDEILFLTLCAVICGAEGWGDIEDFGKTKLEYLRQYLDYSNGVPSDDTFRRFYRHIDPKEFEKLFHNWVSGIAKQGGAQLIAIDG